LFLLSHCNCSVLFSSVSSTTTTTKLTAILICQINFPVVIVADWGN
jgi:hypothetical protein